MDLKEYNAIQIAIFKRYGVNPADSNFIKVCSIIGAYRTLNNKFYFLNHVLHDLRKEKLI